MDAEEKEKFSRLQKTSSTSDGDQNRNLRFPLLSTASLIIIIIIIIVVVVYKMFFLSINSLVKQ